MKFEGTTSFVKQKSSSNWDFSVVAKLSGNDDTKGLLALKDFITLKKIKFEYTQLRSKSIRIRSVLRSPKF
jgi:hypothetical protein